MTHCPAPNFNSPFIRSPYNYNPMQASKTSGLICPVETLAQQSFKDECDINNILRKFNVTGEIMGNPRQARFGDFTGVSDYKTALDAILDADNAFMALPATLRERFNNDPHALLEFIGDPANRAEAVDLGLVDPPTESVAPATVVESTASDSGSAT